jgi:hypothetical protein
MDHPIKPQDESFYEELKAKLEPGAVIPLFFRADGTLDREKIMELPCFLDADR